ncbi:MAG: hypothetical protein ACJ8CB_35425 [Ktedonobacteraceae bacterium]
MPRGGGTSDFCLSLEGQQELLFPEGIYNTISEYYEAQVKAEEGHKE